MTRSTSGSLALAALLFAPACFDPEPPAATTEGSTGADATTTAPVDPLTTGADTTTAPDVDSSASEGSSTTAGSTSSASEGSSEGSSDGTSTTGAIGCAPGEHGPECAPCDCVNGSCDDGMDGTGTCTCAMGWTGSACDWDCGPGGEVQGDGSCRSVLVAVEDAFVCSGDWAAMNFGSNDFTPRAVGQQNNFTGNQIGRALYKFELAALPAGIGITAAHFHVKQYDNFAGFPTTVQLRPSPSTWMEGTVTWNNQPAAPNVILGTANVGCCGEEHQIEVTGAVEAALDAGQAALSIQLRSNDETTVGGVRWFFREGDGVNINGIIGAPPTLELSYTVP